MSKSSILGCRKELTRRIIANLSSIAAESAGYKETPLPNDNSEEYISIGNLARIIGITTRTLRYYEEMGIMTPPWRMEGSVRAYTPEDVRKLKFILKLKE